MEGSLERHDILSYLNCKIGLPHFGTKKTNHANHGFIS